MPVSLESSIRFGLGGLMLSALVVSAIYRGRAARVGGTPSRRGEGPFMMVALRLAGLGSLGGILLWVAAPGALSFAAWPLPAGLRLAGLALAMIAFGLQVWVLHSLGLNITDTVVVRENATLVTHGPYRWIRHPLYSFGSLWALGAGLATANGFLIVATLLFAPLLAARTGREEANLIARFGDAYRDYMRRTGPFVPGIGLRR